ncbi:MAG: phosphatidylserine decarboxylase [Candidatus Caldarchaeum sp.]
MILAAIAAVLAAIVVLVSVLFFYRDPDRRVLRVGGMLLAPSDGLVVSVRRYASSRAPILSKDGRSFSVEEFTDTTLLGSDGTIISIAISPLDVHTVRSPAESKVVHLSRIRGGLKWMKYPDFEYANERVSMVLETPHGPVGLVIVAAPITSSVKTLVKEQDSVAAGGRVARIRLGSLASVLIPDACRLRPAVYCGDRVLAGISILARPVDEHSSKPLGECWLEKRSKPSERLFLLPLLAYATLVNLVSILGRLFAKLLK